MNTTPTNDAIKLRELNKITIDFYQKAKFRPITKHKIMMFYAYCVERVNEQEHEKVLFKIDTYNKNDMFGRYLIKVWKLFRKWEIG